MRELKVCEPEISAMQRCGGYGERQQGKRGGRAATATCKRPEANEGREAKDTKSPWPRSDI
jgi:hypothetical protein